MNIYWCYQGNFISYWPLSTWAYLNRIKENAQKCLIHRMATCFGLFVFTYKKKISKLYIRSPFSIIQSIWISKNSPKINKSSLLQNVHKIEMRLMFIFFQIIHLNHIVTIYTISYLSTFYRAKGLQNTSLRFVQANKIMVRGVRCLFTW